MHTDSKKEMKHRCSIQQKAYLICSLNVQFNDKKSQMSTKLDCKSVSFASSMKNLKVSTGLLYLCCLGKNKVCSQGSPVMRVVRAGLQPILGKSTSLR